MQDNEDYGDHGTCGGLDFVILIGGDVLWVVVIVVAVVVVAVVAVVVGSPVLSGD